jgi:cation transport ATPase
VVDAAIVLTDILEGIPGVLHAQVNYAAELISIAYDTQVVQRATIEQAIRRIGYQVLPVEQAHDGHGHGSAPTLLPHWMQERWTFILVGVAGLFLSIVAMSQAN